MIVLIRHAHTDMAGSFCGHSDPPLSARGLEQLEELKRAVSSYRFTHVFSSDLQRARQTADSLAGDCQNPVHTLASLREIAFGDWEGLTWEQITARDAAYAGRWLDAFPAGLPAPNGESFSDFSRRIDGAMNVIADEVQGGCAAVVTHAGVISTFLKHVAGLESAPEIPYCDYCSCWEVSRDAGRRWIAAAKPGLPQVNLATEGGH